MAVLVTLKHQEGKMNQRTLKTTLLASTLILTAAGSAFAADQDQISFKMVVSKDASTCLPNAQASNPYRIFG
jgi:hypothetical protein